MTESDPSSAMEPKPRRQNRKRIIRPHDARAVRSRAALAQALLELIDEKDFNQITIRDITNQAGVSYPVFFRQYATTEQLLLDIATQQVTDLLTFCFGTLDANGEGRLDDLCDYVIEHRKLWTTLLTAGASPVMRQEFSRITNEFVETHERTNPDLPPELITELVTNSIFDILTWWLRQDETYPKANVVKLLEALVVRPFASRIEISLE